MYCYSCYKEAHSLLFPKFSKSRLTNQRSQLQMDKQEDIGQRDRQKCSTCDKHFMKAKKFTQNCLKCV